MSDHWRAFVRGYLSVMLPALVALGLLGCVVAVIAGAIRLAQLAGG